MTVHYGDSNRAGYTPCGEWAADVTVSFDWVRVTDPACLSEGARVGAGAAQSVPADVNDDVAWAEYLAATTPEPTDAERIATLIAVANPYADKRAGAVEGFKRTARMLWRHRRAEGYSPRSEAFNRATMRTYSACIRNYDRLAREWAVRELADMRDLVEAVTVR